MTDIVDMLESPLVFRLLDWTQAEEIAHQAARDIRWYRMKLRERDAHINHLQTSRSSVD